MIKRIFDLVMGIVLFTLAAPMTLLIALVLRFSIGKGVIFKQLRPGLHGRPFTILKFKTMKDSFDENGDPEPDSQRLTPIGKLLRATSLDELPELVNVIKGEMSLVGPRPLLMRYLERYTPEQARRHEVKPGITGLAQVKGRNAISWEEKFKLDVWYVDNMSFWFDLKIIASTIKKVIKREGVSAEGVATMPEFNPQISKISSIGPEK